MKTLLLLMLLATGADAAWVAGSMRCDEWLRYRETPGAERMAAYGNAWVLGYASGVNMALSLTSTTDLLAGRGGDQIIEVAAQFCATAPGLGLVEATNYALRR
jgi:hypothetical protein